MLNKEKHRYGLTYNGDRKSQHFWRAPLFYNLIVCTRYFTWIGDADIVREPLSFIIYICVTWRGDRRS
jgi:hypothetical protein